MLLKEDDAHAEVMLRDRQQELERADPACPLRLAYLAVT